MLPFAASLIASLGLKIQQEREREDLLKIQQERASEDLLKIQQERARVEGGEEMKKDDGEGEQWKRKKAPNWNMMVPLLYAPMLPLCKSSENKGRGGRGVCLGEDMEDCVWAEEND